MTIKSKFFFFTLIAVQVIHSVEVIIKHVRVKLRGYSLKKLLLEVSLGHSQENLGIKIHILYRYVKRQDSFNDFSVNVSLIAMSFVHSTRKLL